MPRPKKESVIIKARISPELHSKMVSTYPHLIDQHPSSGEKRVRYGGMTNYISRLIERDLAIKQELRKNSNVFDKIFSEAPDASGDEIEENQNFTE